MDPKVILIGDTCVGKTTLYKRLVLNKFDAHIPPTLAGGGNRAVIDQDGVLTSFHLWDTAGQERFRCMAPIYFEHAQVALLVFSLTSQKSLLSLCEWAKLLKSKRPEAAMIGVGTKLDLTGERTVPWQIADQTIREIGCLSYTEISSLTAFGLDELKYHISREVRSAARRPSEHGPSYLVKKKRKKRCC
jgi:small GTP-binding protein